MLVVFLLRAQNWEWVTTLGGTNSETSNNLIYAPNGYLYCSGGFVGGDWTAGPFYVYGGGLENGFIAKYSTDGTLIKLKGGHGMLSLDRLSFNGMACDQSNNMYLLGSLTGDALLDTVYLSSPVLGSVLLKYDQDLNIQRGKLNTGPSGLQRLSKPVFSGGELYGIGGIFGDSIVLDTVSVTNLDGNQSAKDFWCSFDTSLTCKQALVSHGGMTMLTTHACHGSSFLLTARADSCFIFDTLQQCGPKPYGAGAIFKIDTNGHVNWQTTISSPRAYGIVASCYDNAGNIYLCGTFDSILQLQDTLLVEPVSSGYYSTFIVKYDTAGQIAWVRQWYNTADLVVNEIISAPANYCYITGFFSGDISFGQDTLKGYTGSNLFVAALDKMGTCKGLTVATNALGQSIAIDSAGPLYVCGQTYSGSSSFGTTTVETSGGSDFFIGRLDNLTGLSFKTEEDEKLKIYANPNNGQFTIQLPEGTVHEKQLELQISSMSGVEVYSGIVQLSNNQVRVDLGVIGKGTYSVSLSSKLKQYTGLVVVQ